MARWPAPRLSEFARKRTTHARWTLVALETEFKLIERLVRRDERAFNELVRLYEHRVFSLVLRFLGNRAEAEELSQEVFVQVFKAIGSFRGDSKLSTWIYRIAINLCKNRNKYLKLRHAHETSTLSPSELRPPHGGEEFAENGAPAPDANVPHIERPDEMLAGKQLEQIVQRSILRLEPSFRECLILRDVEELSYEEVEQITSLPAGTVKSRIFRARAMLKEMVERELGEKIR